MPLFLNDHKQGDAIFRIYLLKFLSLNKRRFASLGNQILILWMIGIEDSVKKEKGYVPSYLRNVIIYKHSKCEVKQYIFIFPYIAYHTLKKYFFLQPMIW